MWKSIILITAFSVLVFGGFEIYSLVVDQSVETIVDDQSAASTSPKGGEVVPGGLLAEKSSPKYQGQALRNIGNDPVVKTLTDEIVATKKAELNKFAEIAEKNFSDGSAWLKISEIKKFFNNYKGSVDALEYLKLLSPDDFLVNLNLGNLYGFYLKDYKKAEQNFANAMNHSGGAQLAEAISALADLYKDFYKEKYDQVDDLLLVGIEAVPNDVNLVMKLAFYYKETGNKEGAIQSFERLLSMRGFLTGAQQKAFEDEIVALKQS